MPGSFVVVVVVFNLFFLFSRSRIWPESQLFAYSGILTDAVLYLGRIVKM